MFDHDLLTHVTTTDQLVAAMDRLREQADVTYRDLAVWGRRNGKPLARSTVHEVIAGKRRPRLELVLAFVRGCGITDPAAVTAWEEAWQRTAAVTAVAPEFERAPAHSFFTERDNLEEINEMILTAQEEVWLWGAILEKHIPFLREYFAGALALLKNLDTLRTIRSHTQALAVATGRPVAENLQVRTIDYLGPYTLYGYDPQSPSGMLEMRLSTFRGVQYHRPTFRLRPADGVWFAHFRHEFEKVWAAAHPLT